MANGWQNDAPDPDPDPDPQRDLPSQPETITAPQLALVVPTDAGGESKPKRGSRLPPDWQPSEGTQEWARREGVTDPCGKLLDEFRDFWVAQPGQRGVKLDWDATYRNRLRQVATRQPMSARPPPSSGPRSIRQPHDSGWVKRKLEREAREGTNCDDFGDLT